MEGKKKGRYIMESKIGGRERGGIDEGWRGRRKQEGRQRVDRGSKKEGKGRV